MTNFITQKMTSSQVVWRMYIVAFIISIVTSLIIAAANIGFGLFSIVFLSLWIRWASGLTLIISFVVGLFMFDSLSKKLFALVGVIIVSLLFLGINFIGSPA
jgi:hypothetical protein